MPQLPRAGRWDREESETEYARVVAFSDGVIAIAITLLVLNFDTPEVADADLSVELARLWPSLASYAISFIVIGAMWMQHHRFFGELRSIDARLMVLNLLYLSLIVLIPFTTDVLDNYADVPAAPILYASVLATAGVVSWAMANYAIRVGLIPEADRRRARHASRWGLATPAVFLLSIPLALVTPQWAPVVWLVGLVITARRGDG